MPVRAIIGLLALAGCLETPGAAVDAAPPDAAPPPQIACEVPEDCPGDVDAARCHCGSCAFDDPECAASGLRYTAANEVGACVPGPEELALGLELSCLRWSNGRVSCWGDNCNGQLGDGVEPDCPGSIDPGLVPHLVRLEAGGDPLTDVRALEAGLRHVCALRGDGTVWCWGDNLSGKVGDGMPATIRPAPVQVLRESDVQPLTGIEVLAAGGNHTCAADSEGIAWCWGNNDYYQLGVEAPGARGRAAPVPGSEGWSNLHGGGLHTCGVKPDDGDSIDPLWCWGGDTYGQLGDGNPSDPGSVAASLVGYEVSPTVRVVPFAVGLGVEFSCAAVVGPKALCWGRNIAHALGDEGAPTTDDGVDAAGAREAVLIATSAIEEIAAGGDFACARLASGALWCWGGNAFGQLGIGGISPPAAPTQAASEVTAVAAGVDHACAITPDHRVVCWGTNAKGQLGDGTTEPKPSPTDVVELCQ